MVFFLGLCGTQPLLGAGADSGAETLGGVRAGETSYRRGAVEGVLGGAAAGNGRATPPAAINADAPLAAETSSGGMGDIDVGDRNAGRFSSFSSSAFRVGGARLRLRSASPPPETRPITAHIAAAASAVSAAPATSAAIVSLTTDRVSADAGADANVAARVASSSSSSSPI